VYSEKALELNHPGVLAPGNIDQGDVCRFVDAARLSLPVPGSQAQSRLNFLFFHPQVTARKVIKGTYLYR